MKYLGETSSESAASESPGEGDIGFGLAIGHHCVKRTAELAGGEREREKKTKSANLIDLQKLKIDSLSNQSITS